MWTKQEALAVLDREKRKPSCCGDCGTSELPAPIRNYYEWKHAAQPAKWKPVAASATIAEPEPDRTSDAYMISHLETVAHEVRHVVTCLDEGGRVNGVTADGPNGLTDCDFRGMSEFSRALVSMAGGVAGGRASSSDKDYMVDELRRHGVRGTDSQVLDYAYGCQEHVEAILARRWQFVKALKAMLFKHRKLTGAQVHQLWDLYA